MLQLEISNRGEDAYETNFYLGANHYIDIDIRHTV